MSEKCPFCGQTDRPLFGALYIRAFSIANRENQLIGEKHDLFITLGQLQNIVQEIIAEELKQGTSHAS